MTRDFIYLTIEGITMSVEYEHRPAVFTSDSYDPSYFKVLRVYGEKGIIWLIRTHFEGVYNFLDYIEEEIIRMEYL